MKNENLFVGTSGFTYDHWGGGVFYPDGVSKHKWLEYYAQFFDTTELNVTFYRLPSENAFEGWYRRTPQRFSFAVKGSRFITHIKKLHEMEEPLQLFIERVSLLKEKVSVVLWQLPPSFHVHVDRLSFFVALLGRWRSVIQVFEFRHESWFCEDVYRILKKSNMAVCQADWPEITVNAPITADFVYLRRHGPAKQMYRGCYSHAELRSDAKKIQSLLKEGKRVYIYFNNDESGYAVKNALALKKMLV
ncbi:MAG: DUF72 domain-containing protein [Candidatus Kuenenia sp.]|nr:DUF72 domain-containing protein [Candidatus Kuenenia hertensis]